MKKFLAVLLVAVMAVAAVFALAACEGNNGEKTVTKENIKVGFIFLHDQNSTYDANFIDAAKETAKELGLKDSQIVLKTGVPESEKCTEEAKDLVDQGCDIIFADSFGHEEYLIPVAKANPNVQFCHATGTKAHTEKLANYHNAFASVYEGRYLAGVAAGMKLNEMNADKADADKNYKMGYVGAFPYAEVKSGYTSFYLGAKSVCADVTMEVRFTNSWYDEAAEKATAEALIAAGCALISQHADSQGAPAACETAGVPNVFYNGSNLTTSPKTYLIASKINWVPYMTYMINSVINGTAIATDWTGTLENGAVQVLDLNTAVAAEGTAAKLAEVEAKLKDGSLKVFDTATFTVDGKTLTSYKADVDDLGDFQPDTEVIANGVFEESKYRSAPYFDIDIDGINAILPD